ncbi:MAG: formyl-CoA transferase [Actinomycetota bacterium]|nr:formyl-CoA transferase [Actinomycetota bacterium]
METQQQPVRTPLEGIRVLELGNFIAAPSAGRLLAEFGAEVIKVEEPGTGDQVRDWRLFRGETSMMWRTLGRNKKSITIDVRTEQGQELVRLLAGQVDVVLENYRPGKLESWHLSPDELRRDNAQLVVVRISGYGQTGPYRDRPGFGGVAEAMGGLRFITGYPDRPPTRLGASIGDTLAGLYAVIGALMGLQSRDRGLLDAGETVDVALTEAVYSVMESFIPEYTAYGNIRSRTGNEMPGVAPSNTYPCGDGEWVVIGGNADGIFHRLMTAIGRTDLAADKRFHDNSGRATNSKLLDDAIASWTSERTLSDVMEVMVAASVPAGPIYSAADITRDPHFRDRGMLLEMEVEVEEGKPEPVTFPGIVPKLDRLPGRVNWLGPELGEHTHQILSGLLNLDEREIAELREGRIV